MMGIASRESALAFGILLFAGCSLHRQPDSLSHSFDEVGLRLPTSEAIRRHGKTEEIPQAFERVWPAALEVASQQFGLVSVAAGEGSGRLLFIGGVPATFRRGARLETRLATRWIAVEVERKPADPDVSLLSLAWVPPRAGATAFFVDDRVKTAHGSTSLSRIVAARFAYAVEQFSIPEEVWLADLVGPLPAVRSDRLGESVSESSGRQLRATRRLGGFVSLERRRLSPVLYRPKLQRLLREVVSHLQSAAGLPAGGSRIFLLAESRPNAHVAGNGDIFLTTGQLHAIREPDELAGVLAHEIGHVVRRDYVERRIVRSRQRMTVGILGGLAMAGASAAAGAFESPDSAAPEDTLLTTEEAIVGGLVIAGSMLGAGYVSNLVGTGISDRLFSGFSQDQEIAADAAAAWILWNAGYDPGGLLEVLKRRDRAPVWAPDPVPGTLAPPFASDP